MPHLSMLVDRLEYPARQSLNSPSDAVVEFADSTDIVRFTQDHPLADVPTSYEPLPDENENKYARNVYFHQTPSVVDQDQIHHLLTNEERLKIFPHETIVPRKYSLRPLQTIYIAGLARLDLLTANSVITVTVFASKYLPVHVIATRKADQFYRTFLGSVYLGPPICGRSDQERQQRLDRWPGLESSKRDFLISSKPKFYDKTQYGGSADVVFSSVGCALVDVSPDQDCIVRAFTPEGRGIHLRDPPLLPYGRSIIRAKKIRDTPLFAHPSYLSKRMPA